MTRSRIIGSIGFAVALLLGAAACGDDSDTSSTTTAPSGTEQTTTTTSGDDGDDGGASGDALQISGSAFPSEFAADAGADVQVVNQDGTAHTVTADGDEWDELRLEGDSDGSFTAPSEPGEYTYHCDIHDFMTGTLVVT